MAQSQKYEKPCIQCGKCCKEEICIFGDAFFDNPAPPCPALVFKEDKNGEERAWCGLIVETEKFVSEGECEEVRERLLREFNFGVGCDY